MLARSMMAMRGMGLSLILDRFLSKRSKLSPHAPTERMRVSYFATLAVTPEWNCLPRAFMMLWRAVRGTTIAALVA
jgi:hypothetical protein